MCMFFIFKCWEYVFVRKKENIQNCNTRDAELETALVSYFLPKYYFSRA